MKVEMRGIVKQFGSVRALDRVDIEFAPGEIHAVLGENGAGKSTLMNILSGSMRPDQGEIIMNGEPVRIDSPRTARRLGIAMLHQHFTLVPAFTVAENLALDSQGDQGQQGLKRLVKRLRYSPADESAQALERARGLGWEIEPNSRVGDLSVGMQQRVEIVKTLATDANLLIFDEPTAVLAGSEVEELFEVLRKVRSEGAAVVLIAHKLAEILAIADRITVLRQGRRVVSILRSDTDARALAEWMVGEQKVPQNIAPQPPNSGGLNSPAPSEIDRAGGAVADQSLPDDNDQERLSAVGISVRGDRGEQAIREVSFEVRRGEIFGIGGVDGNGQSELAEALVGLRPLASGRIDWTGGPFVPGETPSTGYIPQDRRRHALAITMSIEENLILDAVRERRFRRGPFLRKRALRDLASELIRRYDIRIPGVRFPASSLSGGNQQKIVVARALRSEPEWIVAVNPTRGLDIAATRFVREQLLTARQRGAAVLVISTDLDELAAIADRTAILTSGNLTAIKLAGIASDALGLALGGLAPGNANAQNAAETAR